jgi:hypothetical protein
MTIFVIKTVMLLQKQFNCITAKARVKASSLRLISRLLPKIHFSETQTAGSRLLF